MRIHLHLLRDGKPLCDELFHTFCMLMLASTLICTGCVYNRAETEHDRETSVATAESATADQIDAMLEQVAVTSLGDREGAVIVMDPATGRIRTVVNPVLAFEQAYPPGSAIKPFTALAALKSGLINEESTWLCRGRYNQGGFEIMCSHPKSEMPFHLPEALAHSCNYWFAIMASRLSEGVFNSTLASFGFGLRTGVNTSNESTGRLPGGDLRVENALGEGEKLLVTPVQLITAYSALVNGGCLVRPRFAGKQHFRREEKARLAVSDRHLAQLVEGMRNSVRYGTSSASDLAFLPVYVFGKTGTSTSSNGFRTQGWFVGFAAAERRLSPRVAVLVFLRRSHGSDAARIARPVFEKLYEQLGPALDENDESSPYDSRADSDSPSIKVRLITEKSTIRVPLEEYVSGVLGAESSTESEMEALKAQAVVSRTFALNNPGRHSADQYDFCSSTHCQRYRPLAGGSENPTRAVAATRGQVLVNERGEPVDVYFHAACGGMTANIGTLWGTNVERHLRGVRDDYCATMPHRNWIDTIPASQLVRALKSDPATNVGARLDAVIVTKRDVTGRAESIALEGERRREVHGWDFKMIVGRSLGWNILKSSRFEVSRQGAVFVFRGSGFGHGIGLCQEGAHVMAARRISYEKILDHYLPGVGLATNPVKSPDKSAARRRLEQGDALFETTRPVSLDLIAADPACALPWIPEPARGSGTRVLSSEHFRVQYPESSEEADVALVLGILERTRSDLERKLGSAFPTSLDRRVADVTIHSTTQDFVAATGQPWWAAAATGNGKIDLQPAALLKRKRILPKTLQHEFTHLVIDAISRGSAPRWLAEGLAIHIAGEGQILAKAARRLNLTTDELERRIRLPSSLGEMRALYYTAYLKVRAIITEKGEAAVWRELARAGS